MARLLSLTFISLEVVEVMVLIHPCRALSGVIVVTKKDEDK